MPCILTTIPLTNEEFESKIRNRRIKEVLSEGLLNVVNIEGFNGIGFNEKLITQVVRASEYDRDTKVLIESLKKDMLFNGERFIEVYGLDSWEHPDYPEGFLHLFFYMKVEITERKKSLNN